MFVCPYSYLNSLLMCLHDAVEERCGARTANWASEFHQLLFHREYETYDCTVYNRTASTTTTTTTTPATTTTTSANGAGVVSDQKGEMS